MDRGRNEEVCIRAGIERELSSRADQRVLRWFGYVERMDEYHMAEECCWPKSVEDRYEGDLSWVGSIV